MNYKIITDSCCDLTPEMKRELDVTTIPLTMRLGAKEYIDDDNLDLPAFMSDMAACTEKVGSSSPSPALYQNAFEKAKSAFAVTLSSKLSGSYASAVMGKEFAQENGSKDIHVFDSKSATAGQTLLTVKLGDWIEQNLNMGSIIEHANNLIENMKTYFVLENYDNLLKNGRLNKITGKIISLLGIRLVMGAKNGEIALFHKARGENQVLEKMLALIASSGKSTEGEQMVITHCNNLSLAEKLAIEIKSRFNFGKIHILPTGGLSSMYADNKGIVMAF